MNPLFSNEEQNLIEPVSYGSTGVNTSVNEGGNKDTQKKKNTKIVSYHSSRNSSSPRSSRPKDHYVHTRSGYLWWDDISRFKEGNYYKDLRFKWSF